MTQTTHPNDSQRPRAIDRILNSRGAVPSAPPPEAASGLEHKAAFVESGGKPQMAFSVAMANGEMHGFHYFNIDNLKFIPKVKGDFITFDHRGKVVVLSGTALQPIYTALISQTLVSIQESAMAMPVTSGTHVRRVEITSL